MSIQTEIQRITTAKTTLKNKGVELGISLSTDKIDAIATKFDGIVNRGAVSSTVQEGETYTIPAGYHNGAGTVAAVSGGGNYTLQAKTVTPTKAQQSIVSDDGYYGLSGVTVSAIPDTYQDTSSVTAVAADVLSTKVFVTSAGAVAGTMANNGAVAGTINALSATEYIVPAGYHNGTGKVTITNDLETALAAI